MEYAIVDIETTGSYASGNSITEIAILIHNGQHVIERYQTLINPGSFIPFHIQALTGISNEMVEDAPPFSAVAATVYQLLHKRIFVAHNVNFDYSFIVQELQMAGYSWKAPKLCTVRLSRKIIPNMASYSLGKLCHNLGIPIQDRHRAMGDAEATVILFEHLLHADSAGIIAATLKKTKEQRLPTHINEEDFLRLPETAGVYLFLNRQGKVLYIGKAVNIKKRVLSHFSGNSGTLKRQAFMNEIRHIDFEESGTELMALLMECQLIKKHWPPYNRALKKFEPKFALIHYEDQGGYQRLLVAPYHKHAEALQYFERPYEGNQLLLELMERYQLDSKFCQFYSVEADGAKRILAGPTTNSLPGVEVAEHNAKIEAAIRAIEAQRRSFVLIDQGRNLNEKSYIYYKDDHLHAFGFVDADNQSRTLADIVSEKDRCLRNYYMTCLVLQYAERFPSKVHRLPDTE
ncbi:exonuclease domain-containing protein [Sphingobacterium sp. Mn56C]|uniref:exonuclease domain-containing protein n=1 Tax=Sphingobacterium sp. Mn56C TaxID=3395261 RepID=UPI003BE53FB2